MPTFSILIPAYKGQYLGEALTSCIQQSFSDFEVIVVDDCSPYNLQSIVALYNDGRIRYFRNENNIGAVNVVDNWNKCLALSKGDYIICIGDDDKLLPDCLQLYIELQAKYPHLDVYHAWTQIIDEQSNVVALQESRPEWESALAMQYYRWDCRWKQFIGDFCFRAKTLKEAGGFYKLPLAWGSDDVSVFRAAMKGGIANTQQFGFQYRVNRYTITNSGNQQLKAEAHLDESKWFRESIPMCSKQHEADELFRQLLMAQVETHYQSKIVDMMEADLALAVRNLKYWLKNRERYGFSSEMIWKTYLHVVRKTKRIKI